MSIFTKKRTEYPGSASPAAKRAALLATHDLVPWAETCLYEIGRNLTGYSRDQDLAALAEATNATEVLQAIIAEINGRAGETVVGPAEHQQ